jgi:hypothetical protein
MPNIRKVIKDIVSAPFDKYDKFYSDLQKKGAAQDKLRFARENDIAIAREHERRMRGDLSGEPTISKAIISMIKKDIAREADIESARKHEENKARGTSSSAVRKIIK